MNLEQCDPNIYENGTPVAVIGDMDKEDIETLVTKLSLQTGVQMDWSWMAGRARYGERGTIPALLF